MKSKYETINVALKWTIGILGLMGASTAIFGLVNHIAGTEEHSLLIKPSRDDTIWFIVSGGIAVVLSVVLSVCLVVFIASNQYSPVQSKIQHPVQDPVNQEAYSY